MLLTTIRDSAILKSMKQTSNASAIDLVILGVLLEHPFSAYDLARLIEEKQVYRFLKISTPAIYKSCRRLYAAGVLEGDISRKGRQPEKTIYRINEAGKERFMVLMEKISSNTMPFYLDFNAAIFHLEKVGKRHGLELLKDLRDELSKWKEWIVQHEQEQLPTATFAAKAIMKQYRMTISALFLWAKELVDDYEAAK